METNREIQQSEDFATQYEQHLDDARDAFVDDVYKILMPVTHMVSITQNVMVDDVPVLAKAMKDARKLRFYDFTVMVEGKYRVYDETFGYDFTDELKTILSDELGYEGDV